MFKQLYALVFGIAVPIVFGLVNCIRKLIPTPHALKCKILGVAQHFQCQPAKPYLAYLL